MDAKERETKYLTEREKNILRSFPGLTEDKLEKANEKLQTASAGDKAEKEKLSEEIKALQKRLAMSGEEMTAFKLRFEAWQKAYAVMMQALGAVSPEQKEKCTAAVRAVVGKWSADNGK